MVEFLGEGVVEVSTYKDKDSEQPMVQTSDGFNRVLVNIVFDGYTISIWANPEGFIVNADKTARTPLNILNVNMDVESFER